MPKKNLNDTSITLKNQTGKLSYNMTNDYMFRAVLQKNTKVLKGLIGALLHLDPESIDVKITNPVILGQSFANKDFVLDVNIIINNEIWLNLEMQIINYHNWKERSLSYLCHSFGNIYKGDDYTTAIPVIQIGFLDFDLFPEAPEFYATYVMKNVKNNMIYTDKLQMSVIELNHIELATEEDRLYGVDKWAAFFKLETWEELKAMAATNQYMQSAADTIFELSSDKNIRDLCRRRAEYEADERRNARNVVTIQKQEAIIAEKESIIAEKENVIAEKESIIAETKSALAETESVLAHEKAEKERLLAELEKLKKEKN